MQCASTSDAFCSFTATCDAFQITHGSSSRSSSCQILTSEKLMIQMRRLLQINSKYMSARIVVFFWIVMIGFCFRYDMSRPINLLPLDREVRNLEMNAKTHLLVHFTWFVKSTLCLICMYFFLSYEEMAITRLTLWIHQLCSDFFENMNSWTLIPKRIRINHIEMWTLFNLYIQIQEKSIISEGGEHPISTLHSGSICGD